jgi:UDP-glucuronate 4-epimerase
VGRRANVVSYPMPPGDVPRTCADISKAKRLLGYDPRTPFEEGMARFVNWYRAEVAGQ